MMKPVDKPNLFVAKKQIGSEIKTFFYDSKRIKEEIPYVNGKKTGRAKTYYESGIIESQVDYCEDIIHGYVRSYYEDGSLESVETYSNGVSNEDLKLFDRNGFMSYSRALAESSTDRHYGLVYDDYIE